jgi:chemotaxis protein methyltransferase CheR
VIHSNISVSAGARSPSTVIAALLEQRTGQQLSAARAWRMETALKPVLRNLGMMSLDELVHGLVVSRDGALADQVVDALLNQETSFFRDAPVVEQLGDALAQIGAASGGRRLRIWSAGCSNGQEPLSLAMLLAERGFADEASAPDLVATDVSAGAVARAREGRYSQFEVQRGLSIHRMLRWFDQQGGDWVAKRELLRRVQVRQHNLTSDSAPVGTFDAILCRNVLLYLSPELRRTVFDTLASALRPDGVLVLGASETVIGQTDRFQPHPQWRGFYRLVPGAR